MRQINADINAVLAEKDIIDKFAAQGAEVSTGTPQELAAQLHNDIQQLGGGGEAVGRVGGVKRSIATCR